MTDYTGSNTPADQRDLWRTPPALFAALDAEFCFQLDAAAAPHNALCRQYEQLLDFDQVQLQFEPEALEAVAQKAIDRKIGARGLRAVLEDLMIPIMYEIPSDPDVERVVITKRCVGEGCAPDIYRKGAKALEPGEHAAGA